jgi:hypothetical protein
LFQLARTGDFGNAPVLQQNVFCGVNAGRWIN